MMHFSHLLAVVFVPTNFVVLFVPSVLIILEEALMIYSV
jgi:hypothetical protein